MARGYRAGFAFAGWLDHLQWPPMHVALINPPQVFSRFQVAAGITPPLGVAYLAAYLREHNVPVSLVDALGEAPSAVTPFRRHALLRGLDLDQTVARVDPAAGLIGISNLFTFAWPAVDELARRLKQRFPDTPIAVGGPHPGALPAECLESPWIDFVGIGEGEVPLLALARSLRDGGDGRGIPGIAWRDEGGEVHAEASWRSDIVELDTVPFPARDLLPMENYVTTQEAHGPVDGRWTSILSSRGCPYGCTFCESRLTRWRARSAVNVVDEIEECVTRWGISEFHFEDDNMTLSAERISELAAELDRRNLRIRWQTPNGIRASAANRATLTAMRDSGCNHITLAPESGSQRVLDDVIQKGKDFELDALVDVARIGHELGMKVAAYFILGLPGETEAEAELSIAYAQRLARAGVDEVGFGLFIPLPGTPLWDAVDRTGLDYLDLLTVDDLEHAVSFNEHLDDDDLRRLRRKAYALFFLTRARHHPRELARTVGNVLRFRQELKTDRVLISLARRNRDAALAYPYDAARTLWVLLDTESSYAFRHSFRRAVSLLRRRPSRRE